MIQRAISGILVLWVTVTLTFVAMRLMGDPVLAVLGRNASPSAAERQAVIESYGLDAPVWEQYLRYVGRVFTGDFGISYTYRRDVADIIADQAAGTVPLTILAFVLAWAIALVGILLTAGRGRVLGKLGGGLEILSVSSPQLWVALGLLIVFGFTLGWFPVSGDRGFPSLVLPSVALAIPLAGYLGQVTRNTFEHSLAEPFVLSARSRGSSDLSVRTRHVLRHAAIPAVTLSGFAVGWLLSGAVIVETVFGRPGLGSTLLRAVQSQDVPLTGAIVMLCALVYVVATILVDLLVPLIDPRLRKAA